MALIIHCSESFAKVTLLEGEGVAIFVVLSVIGKGDDGGLTLLVVHVLGIFKIWFDAIININQINEVLVVFGNLYRYFA